MDQRSRKPTRLKNYDYSAPGAYFITICTREKRCVLSEIEFPPGWDVGAAISRPLPVLTEYGKFVEQAVGNIPTRYPSVNVAQYVIMPNHVHMILQIRAGEGGRMISAPTVSTVVGQMKRWISKKCGVPLWQRSFYDHVVRSETEYDEIARYIDDNPAKWTEDRFYPQ